MTQRRLAGTPLDFGALRTELGVPGEFSSAALDDAQRAAAWPNLPDLDRTDIEFITVDPAGSKDLDQAVHIAADGDGFLVSYAIADVASFVAAGSTLDNEVRQRGETFYFPDARVPLHPSVLSEGASSLLPDQLAPAALWQIHLDAQGSSTSVQVQRPMQYVCCLPWVPCDRSLLVNGTPCHWICRSNRSSNATTVVGR